MGHLYHNLVTQGSWGIEKEGTNDNQGQRLSRTSFPWHGRTPNPGILSSCDCQHKAVDQHPSLEQGRAHEAPHLAEELLTADGC